MSYNQIIGPSPASVQSNVYGPSLKNGSTLGLQDTSKLSCSRKKRNVFARMWTRKVGVADVFEDDSTVCSSSTCDTFRRSISKEHSLKENDEELHLCSRDDNIAMIKSKRRSAMVHVVKGRLHDGLNDFNECLALQQQVLGPDHPDVAKTLNDMGIILCKMDKSYEYMAMVAFEESLRIRQECFGDGSEEAAETLKNMWCFFHRSGKRHSS